MLKKIIATIILTVSLHAQQEKFQILANNLVTKNDIVIATGNVVAFSPSYYITAKKAIYDKNKGTFELFDDVIVLKNNNVQTKSNYTFLDINTDNMYQKPSLYFEESNSIWISSKDSEKKNDTIFLEEATLSSCDCVDPDWSIRFSSADYDTKDKWINIYNPRIYLKEIPLVYSPYLGFSTDTRRRTGLLYPTFGYSKSEGGFYSQPIYVAPADNYDFEFIPDYRFKRGRGIFGYFRYADSINSILELSAGYFKEYEDYQKENALTNQSHYGVGLNYVRNNILAPNKLGYSDGLYVDINYLNDIEYDVLESNTEDDSVVQKVESKINYIYNTPSYFLGSYFRYYIDTSKTSNGNTLQELPKLQAHTYTRPLFLDKLLVSTDLKYTNHKRNEEINAEQYEFSVPLSYSYSLFDDYLKLILKQEFNFNKFIYSNGKTDYEDGIYSESKTTVSLNSDLVKPYENYIHTVNLFADYNHVHKISEKGDLYAITNNDRVLRPFPVNRSDDTIEFGINQSLYDKENNKQIINHKLTQSLIYDDFNDFKLENIENEITYNYFLGAISNKLLYNHQDKKIIESSSNFSLTYDNVYLKLGYYMSKETENSGKENLESYSLTARYTFSDQYKLSYYTNYNIEENVRTKQGIKFSIADSCWDLDLKYERAVVATSSSYSDSKTQDILYIELFLKPLGGIKQEYKIKEEENKKEGS